MVQKVYKDYTHLFIRPNSHAAPLWESAYLNVNIDCLRYRAHSRKQLSFLKKSLTIHNGVLLSKEKSLKTLVIHYHGVFKP
ncbi:molecular chaperone TorD family protein [Bacillus sp. S10C12M]|uniref:molecular chaperone TorD family protein n=1 Tax=unclassified Bacillus (in: firmicutes) TaxID=185979 RepID=UPI003B023F5A